ncbi:MAG: 8-amino-7-oxononanoate synthase [Planctomycetota bacterium]|nr:8-amino-7-oxononanoate synthase [Planctomycetota bacterium]MDI6788685.1 8-amino-7-oxononanoate synthase [Planctomycetota bacterium]
MLAYLSRELKKLNAEGLLRKPMVIEDTRGVRVKIKGQWFVSFCTNDYLGLTQHPAVKSAVVRATRRFGAGAGSARLLAGTISTHHSLERELAKFKNTEDSLLFTSGYVANLSVITTLIRKEDVIFCDELNHASLVDAVRLTKAEVFIYRHCDMGHLERLLGRGGGVKSLISNTRRRFIITDTTFSMDGDGAPLREIVTLARKYNAYTIIDEAHATGVFGKEGRGLAEELNIEEKTDIIIGTASKALGSIGGFVTGKDVVIDYLRNKARQFIFTTALPPGVCAGTIEALKILRCREGKQLRYRLWQNTNYIKSRLLEAGFDLRHSISPIIPIVIGDTKKTLRISQLLWQKGFYVPTIRPPTVPPGQSRLRLVITAMHTREDIDSLIKILITSIKV